MTTADPPDKTGRHTLRLGPKYPILGAMLVFVLTCAGVVFVITQDSHHTLALAEWNKANARLAEALGEVVQEQILFRRDTLLALASLSPFQDLPEQAHIDPALKGLPPPLEPDKRRLLDPFIGGLHGFSALFVLTPEGDFYLTHPVAAQQRMKHSSLSERPYFQEARRLRAPAISDSFRGADGVPSMTIDVPVLDAQGEIRLHLGGVLHLNVLEEMMNRVDLGGDLYGVLVDRQGRVMARYGNKTSLASHPAALQGAVLEPLPILDLFAAHGQEGAEQDATPRLIPFQEETYAVAHYPLAFGWGLVLAQSEEAALGAVARYAHRESLYLAGIILILGLVGGLAVVVLLRRWEKAGAALRASEERYRSLFAINPVAAVIHRDGKIKIANPAAARLFHFPSAADLVGHSVLDLVAPEDRERVAGRLADTRRAEGATIPSLEEKLLTQTGQVFEAEVTGLRIPFEGETCSLIILRDIDTQKRMQELERQAAQQQEAERNRFAAVLDSIEALVYVADMKSHEVLFINEYLRRRFGDITGRPCWESLQISQEGVCPWCTNDQLVSETGAPRPTLIWEFQNTRIGRWFECHDRAIPWPDGRLVRMEVAIDITERKQAEARQKQLLEILEATPDFIGMAMPDRRILYLNAGARHLVGLPPSAPGMTGFDIPEGFQLADENYRPGDQTQAIWEDKVPEAARSGFWQGESTLFSPDGQEIPVSQIIIAHYNDQGEATHFSTIMRDIRSLKALQKQLHHSNAELEAFGYAVSHDLKEPLRMVSAYLSLLERRHGDKLDGEAHEFIGYAVDGAQRMHRMIQDLLDYARITTRGGEMQPVDLDQVLDEALANLDAAIHESGADIQRPEEGLPTLTGDRSQLVRLFQNLLGNAIKYRHPDRQPRIALTRSPETAAERDTGGVTLRLQDNGIGIPAEEAERIFRVFYRRRASDEREGTGIGLALCRRIVERHGGRLTLCPSPDTESGACFELALPAAPPEIAVANK